ncbi:hypothetical protein ABIA30_001352 [Mycobacterium sp. MAA66]|uniref:DUF4333 domain-containing protein n=1 Tax=Mycobacterium sp. MAA66 TaxID=3156297 RepID=UPI003518D859
MTTMSGTFVATAALLSAAALQLTGCGRPETAQIVPDKAAEFISQEVASKSGFTPTNVSCPSGIEAKVGAQFACTFSGPNGKYTIRMKVTKVDGSYVEYDMSWRLTEVVDDGTGTAPGSSAVPGTSGAPDDSGTPATVAPGTDGGAPNGTDNPSTPDTGGSNPPASGPPAGN